MALCNKYIGKTVVIMDKHSAMQQMIMLEGDVQPAAFTVLC